MINELTISNNTPDLIFTYETQTGSSLVMYYFNIFAAGRTGEHHLPALEIISHKQFHQLFIVLVYSRSCVIRGVYSVIQKLVLHANVLDSELWRIFHGLQIIIWGRGFLRSCFQMTC